MKEISHIKLQNKGDFIVRPGFVYVDCRGSRIYEKGRTMLATGASATISLKDHGIPEGSCITFYADRLLPDFLLQFRPPGLHTQARVSCGQDFCLSGSIRRKIMLYY